MKNKYDEAVSDFFHSKTFKTMVKIFLAVIGMVILCGCVVLVVSGGLVTFISNWINTP